MRVRKNNQKLRQDNQKLFNNMYIIKYYMYDGFNVYSKQST